MASVDDLDELIATRRLNGLDDGLFKESNIEEDIKILEDENQIIYDFTTRKIDDKWKKSYKNIIEFSKNALLESKRDKARIKELEEENKIFVQNGNNVKLEIYIKNNYIPKQKVKDKIEELKQKAINYGHLIDKDEAFRIECEINILEELLEEK